MNPKEIVRAGYNKIASRYGASRAHDSEDIQLLHLLVERLPKGAMVLDAGCGSGHPVAEFLAEFFRVTGVDFSDEQIRLANEKVPNAEFVCADITDLPFDECTFHAVCSYYAIIHIPRGEHPKLLLNFHRILKAGGLALLCMGAGDLPDEIDHFHGTQMFWSHYDGKTNEKIMKENGFDIVWSTVVQDPTDSLAKHLFLLGQKT